MPRFLAVTSRGLIEPLAAELTENEFKNVKVRPDGVEVDCSWSEMRRLHSLTRLATRVLLPVADFTAYNEEDLYYGVLRKHDFTSYIDLRQTLRVEAKVRDHDKLRDQRFVAMKVKDALCDQFRKKFNARPDVGSDEDAALRVVVRVVGPKISLALDLTGESMSNRGYRTAAGEAPLRENVAAGLVRLSGWKPGSAIVDPFCGSGTVLIEAALMAAGLPAIRKPRSFAFEKLKNFTESMNAEPSAKPSVPPDQPRFFGWDSDASVIAKAKENARRAGVEKWISFGVGQVKDLNAPQVEPGYLITNPPYGERLEDSERAKVILSDFATAMKQNFKGWNAWILSGNTEAIKGLRLKAERRVPLWNGPIECRFLHYSIR